jgi:hypothetical protein
MFGFCFLMEDYLLPDCKTRAAVLVWSRSHPPGMVKSLRALELPPPIADRFLTQRADGRWLHTVVTGLDEKTVLDENFLVR